MANFPPVPLDIPPGIVKAVSDAGAIGRYVDGDHIRFWQGRPEKIGGWIKYIAAQTVGVVRGALAWLTADSNRLLALGTYIKAYSVVESLDDITPLRTSGTLGTDPFAVVDTETTVTVTHTTHGITEDGAYVSFSGASAGGGITIDGEYLATYINANSYSIEHSAAATSTATATGGASVTYEYQINAGLPDTAYGLGVGSGPVGDGTVGTARTSGGILREMRTWFFDTFGSLLVVHPSGGTIYTWDEPNAAARAVAVTNAPSSARASFVTAERMIVALGTTTPMTMQWCDRDDNTNWTAATDSTANTRTLQTGNRLIAGARFPGGGGQLFWSDLACYGMQFTSSTDFIYDTPVLAYRAGLIGPTAFEITRDLVIWLTPDLEVMIYTGTVTKAPGFENIQAYIRTMLDTEKPDKITTGFTPDFSEIWFHYVSLDSTDGEPDRYFKVNTDEWAWDEGTLGRTAHVNFPTPGGDVVMTGPDRYIYQHEVGYNADSVALSWSLELGRMSLSNRQTETDLHGFIPDLQRQTGNITVNVKMFERPNSKIEIDDQTFAIMKDDEIVDMVMGGGYAKFTYSGSSLGCDFRFGTHLLDVGPAGASR